jgi:glycosyltransferase involved in cell wall biosynthesis
MRRNESISVVICTHNRADLAHDAIASVLAQDVPQSTYELLIVDNASIDNTHAMAQVFCDAYPNVRYIYEGKVGLSHARNRGWQEAQGEYVAYIDDDCKAPPSWLKAASKIIEKEHTAAIGGPYYAFYNVPKPDWFKDKYGSTFVGQSAHPLEAGRYLTGGNMFLRVDILAKLEGFNPGFGMKGEKQAYAEEAEFFHRLRTKFPDSVLFFDPALFVFHRVRAEKMKLGNILLKSFGEGRDYAKIINQDSRPNKLLLALKVIYCLFEILRSVTWDLLWRDRKLFPYYQNSLYEVSFKLVSKLGCLLGQLRNI